MRISDWSSDVCSSDLRRSESAAKSTICKLIVDPCEIKRLIRGTPSSSVMFADMASRNVRLAVRGSNDWSAFNRASIRSEEHTSELQSLMRISYAVFCLKKKNNKSYQNNNYKHNQIDTH